MNEMNTVVVNGIPIQVDAMTLLSLLAGVKKEAPLFKSYAEMWFDRYKKPSLRPKSIAYYQTVFGHLLPFFGDRPLDAITTSDIQSFIDARMHLSFSTVKHMRSVLHQIFESAIEDGYITKNPTNSRRIVMPTKATERKPLTVDQVQTILSCLHRLPKQEQTLLMLLIYTGERKGEVRGLRWEDIDWQMDLIHVRRAVSCAKNQPTIAQTKSRAGIRDIPLLPELKAFLQPLSPKDGYLLGGRKPLSETQYRQSFQRIEKKITLFGATSHVFRHTFLTMAASHLDPKTLQTIAGHASFEITMNRYVHPREDKVVESTQKLSGLFGN